MAETLNSIPERVCGSGMRLRSARPCTIPDRSQAGGTGREQGKELSGERSPGTPGTPGTRPGSDAEAGAAAGPERKGMLCYPKIPPSGKYGFLIIAPEGEKEKEKKPTKPRNI